MSMTSIPFHLHSALKIIIKQNIYKWISMVVRQKIFILDYCEDFVIFFPPTRKYALAQLFLFLTIDRGDVSYR